MPGAKTESVSVVLDKIAKAKGVPITSIGLAYVLHKGNLQNTRAYETHLLTFSGQRRIVSQLSADARYLT